MNLKKTNKNLKITNKFQKMLRSKNWLNYKSGTFQKNINQVWLKLKLIDRVYVK